MRKMLFLLAAILLIVGCSSVPVSNNAASECATQGIGPCVTGRVTGSTLNRQIPFSAYTSGEPTITTEKWTTDNIIGHVQDISKSVTLTALNNGDVLHLFASTAITVTVPKGSALGLHEATEFAVVNYGGVGANLNTGDNIWLQNGIPATSVKTFLILPRHAYRFKYSPNDGWYAWQTSVDNQGLVQVMTASYQPTTLSTGDHYLSFANATITFTMPKIATITANGTRDGSWFLLQPYAPGKITTVVYPDTCYTVVGGGTCPSTLQIGDLWMFQLNGTVWRGLKLPRQIPDASIYLQATSTTFTNLNPDDTFATNAPASGVIMKFNSAASYKFPSGGRFTVVSYSKKGVLTTYQFVDKVYAATSSTGVTETNQVTLDGGEVQQFVWSASNAHWYSFNIGHN